MHQFFWISGGAGIATIDGAKHKIGSATAISLPPMAVHGFVFQPGIEGWVVTVSAANLQRLLANSSLTMSRLLAPAIFDARGSAELLFSRIADEFGSFSPGRELALTSLAGLLAVWFAREIAELPELEKAPPNRGLDLVQRFLDQVERDFLSRRSVAEFAAFLGVTATHLTRTCQKLAGRPASALINERLALEARRHLTYTSKPVSEIAYSLGFQDPAYFSRFFRKKTGRSPLEFRAANQEKVA
jgi:AraC family transcriptional activator of pobA